MFVMALRIRAANTVIGVVSGPDAMTARVVRQAPLVSAFQVVTRAEYPVYRLFVGRLLMLCSPIRSRFCDLRG